jgi:hypothetical protein
MGTASFPFLLHARRVVSAATRDRQRLGVELAPGVQDSMPNNSQSDMAARAGRV